VSSPRLSAPAPVAYAIPAAAEAVGMSLASFNRILAAGDITRRYPNSTPIITHKELVDWADALPVDKPQPTPK